MRVALARYRRSCNESAAARRGPTSLAPSIISAALRNHDSPPYWVSVSLTRFVLMRRKRRRVCHDWKCCTPRPQRVVGRDGIRHDRLDSRDHLTTSSPPGSGASAVNSPCSAADAASVILVSNWKRLEIRHLCFETCQSSVRSEASPPQNPQMHQNHNGHLAKIYVTTMSGIRGSADSQQRDF
jgi:hypothetical protein